MQKNKANVPVGMVREKICEASNLITDKRLDSVDKSSL